VKTLLAVVIIAAAALVAFNYFTTGELRLLPASPSPEAQELNQLRGDLHAVIRQYNDAAKGSAVSGLDTTFEVGELLHKAQGIEKRVRELQKKVKKESDRQKADKLLREVTDFINQLT
jgi:hypothetical protein